MSSSDSYADYIAKVREQEARDRAAFTGERPSASSAFTLQAVMTARMRVQWMSSQHFNMTQELLDDLVFATDEWERRLINGDGDAGEAVTGLFSRKKVRREPKPKKAAPLRELRGQINRREWWHR